MLGGPPRGASGGGGGQRGGAGNTLRAMGRGDYGECLFSFYSILFNWHGKAWLCDLNKPCYGLDILLTKQCCVDNTVPRITYVYRLFCY